MGLTLADDKPDISFEQSSIIMNGLSVTECRAAIYVQEAMCTKSWYDIHQCDTRHTIKLQAEHSMQKAYAQSQKK